MLGVGAAVSMGGVMLKGAVKISTEKGYNLGLRNIISYFQSKNKNKNPKFTNFLKKLAGKTNEELAELIELKTEEIKNALAKTPTTKDDTIDGLVELTKQMQDMMVNYQELHKEEKQMIRDLGQSIDPDLLAREILQSIKVNLDLDVKVEDIKVELKTLFKDMGLNHKFQELQTNLDVMKEDIDEILFQTQEIRSDVSDIKNNLEGESMGDKETNISDSVMTRSNVATGGRDATNISGVGKYIGNGAINIEGETVHYTNIEADKITPDVWKSALSDVIKNIGIGDELNRDLESCNDEQGLSYSQIASKFSEVDSMYDNMEFESDTLLKMGNALYYSGDYKKAYSCYLKAMKDRKMAARANFPVR